MEDILNALNKIKRVNFGIAPPENLVLLDVKYNFDFIPLLPEEIFIKKEFFIDALRVHRNK